MGTIFTHYRTHEQTRKASSYAGFDGILMELPTGIEPVTSSLPRMRATDCATEANADFTGFFGSRFFLLPYPLFTHYEKWVKMVKNRIVGKIVGKSCFWYFSKDTRNLESPMLSGLR